MRLVEYALLASSIVQLGGTAPTDDSKKEDALPPCTVMSPITGSFFDLSRINRPRPDPDSKKQKDVIDHSWHARGYDYGTNFTLNFCGPVVETLTNVEGVKKADWDRIAGWYELDGKNYSLGFNNSEPVLRGRKLVLNYTDGSPCPSSSRYRRAMLPHTTESMRGSAAIDKDDDDDEDPKDGKSRYSGERRKTTVISLLCERDPTKPQASISFVASPDDCTYFFEARTSAACPTMNVPQQTLGPSGVFGVIAVVAILVYVIGGIVYQRVVMHQRGWYQLPNYALWASIASFTRDMVVMIGASCLRCLPGGRTNRRWRAGTTSGYSGLNGSAGGAGAGMNGDLSNGGALPGVRGGRTSTRGGSGGSSGDGSVGDENWLIDQLDEEWDD